METDLRRSWAEGEAHAQRPENMGGRQNVALCPSTSPLEKQPEEVLCACVQGLLLPTLRGPEEAGEGQAEITGGGKSVEGQLSCCSFFFFF